MRKLVLFMHASLDGFAAGPNGEMDWINVSDEMFDYANEQTNLADTALYGRVTYEMMDNYWPNAADQPGASKHDIEHAAWYNKVAKVVLSETLRGQQILNTTIISDQVSEQIKALKQQEGRNILMLGSPTAVHSLLKDNLIDIFWIFINPIILGQGIPIFSAVKESIKLKLVNSNTFSSGVVCLQYEKE
jgi:dihydrofolate reductase